MSITPEKLAANLRREGGIDRPQTMQKIVLTLEGEVKRVTPVRTGTLRRSITSRVEDRGNRGIVGTNLDYARPVHEGSKPHTIAPRNASVLRFQIGSETIFAKRVRHPGTKGQPFLIDGLRRARGAIDRILEQSGEQFFAEVTR